MDSFVYIKHTDLGIRSCVSIGQNIRVVEINKTQKAKINTLKEWRSCRHLTDSRFRAVHALCVHPVHNTRNTFSKANVSGQCSLWGVSAWHNEGNMKVIFDQTISTCDSWPFRPINLSLTVFNIYRPICFHRHKRRDGAQGGATAPPGNYKCIFL